MVLAFTAECSLSFTLLNNIVDLASEMMYDSKAVRKRKVTQTSMSYKLRHGFANGLDKS